MNFQYRYYCFHHDIEEIGASWIFVTLLHEQKDFAVCPFLKVIAPMLLPLASSVLVMVAICIARNL